jgi:hypothetical protein
VKTLLLISLFLGSACFAADPTPSPIPGASLGDPRRLEKVYVEYIASLDALRTKELAEHKEKSAPFAAAIFESPRKIQLDAKIAATKYCLSALRKEFGLVPPP